jgi:hypothetical protein
MSETPPAPASGPERTRVTPYELAFAEAGFEERLFPAVEDEAQRLGVDATRKDMFGFLSSAATTLREMVPPDAPPDALEQHRAILFHAFNFWRFGKRLYLLESAVARYLVEAAPALVEWEVVVPHATLYIQLPANLFWASIAPDTPPEPVDGFFVTAADGVDALGASYHQIDALMVLGIRRHRAGFSVIPFETEVGAGIAAEWMEVQGRAEGKDFENILPGGEITGLYSILTTAEALKLVARALWYLYVHRDELSREEAEERRAADRPNSVRYSRLAFYRVSLAPEATGGA